MNAKVAVHEAGSWSDQARKIDLVLIGARGQVGTAFRHHLVRQSEALRGEGLDLRLLAAFDRRGFAFDEHGLAPWRVDGGLPARREGDNERLLEILCAQGRAPGMIIDCTASDEIADLYPRVLSNGIGVITANKRANARSRDFYMELRRLGMV